MCIYIYIVLINNKQKCFLSGKVVQSGWAKWHPFPVSHLTPGDMIDAFVAQEVSKLTWQSHDFAEHFT